MKYEKAESALIVILEMLLAIFKNWKKLRGILKQYFGKFLPIN